MTRSPNGVTSALRIASKPTIHVGGWANINRAASAAPKPTGAPVTRWASMKWAPISSLLIPSSGSTV
jgi:hypothetical protein